MLNWLVLSYSLPTRAQSSPRVALWRRLRRLGVVSLAGGSHLLPERDECVEAFQWLAQEIRQAGGEAVVLHVAQIADMTEQQIVALFHAACEADYAAIEAEVSMLEKSLRGKAGDAAQAQDTLGKLRRRQAEVARVDYFDCPAGGRLAARLARVAESLSPGAAAARDVPAVRPADYRNKRWVTRPRPHVDRLACVWLIRRFIDPKAVIRYAKRPQADEVAFDMEGAAFGHHGNLCTFETLLLAFGLDEPGLRAIAEVVHEIDLHDGRYVRPETAGVEATLDGWLLAELPDAALESHGVTLFEGLYQTLTGRRPASAKKKKRGGAA